MDTFIARQPIFDGKLHTFGYELLFRDSLENVFPAVDGDAASSAVLSNSFLCVGIEKLTGGRKAFINFTRNLLLRQVPRLFSNDILYAELLETIMPEQDLITALAEMHRAGCRFALDDFVFHERFVPLMRYADIIKIDIRQTPLMEARTVMARQAETNTKFLAEKVETKEEFFQAREMGFSYFQGYFFSKPEIIRRRGIAPTKLKLLQIIGALNREDVDIHQVETLIKSDVSLSYRLLQHMNSAFYAMPQKVTTIRNAIVYLGFSEVRKIITLLATAKLAEAKPNELVRTSVIRARLCETIGRSGGWRGDLSDLFLVGLFSLMDAILDAEMEEIIGHLPVSDQLKAALIAGEGQLARHLDLARCYETGRWDTCRELMASCNTDALSAEKYAEAVAWAGTFLG